MYLSKVVHPGHMPAAFQALADGYATHQLLCRAFPHREEGGTGRILFRTELQAQRGGASTLVASEKKPDWSILEQENLLRASTRHYQPELKQGQRLRFRLRANVVKRVGDADSPLFGKRVALYNRQDQYTWLTRKARNSGFNVTPEDVVLSNAGDVLSKKKGRTLTHFGVLFDGMLSVTDPQAFSQALQTGIGPAKAFGFGLLSIARP